MVVEEIQKKTHQLRLGKVVYPIKVLDISGGDRRISEPSTVSRVENEIKGPDSYHAPGTHAQSGVQFLRCGNFFVFEKESQQRNSTIHLPKSKFDFKKPFSH